MNFRTQAHRTIATLLQIPGYDWHRVIAEDTEFAYNEGKADGRARDGK